jgi:hypothetical protein
MPSSAARTVEFGSPHIEKSKGFKSAGQASYAVGPPRPIYCPRNALLKNSRTVRRKYGASSVMH